MVCIASTPVVDQPLPVNVAAVWGGFLYEGLLAEGQRHEELRRGPELCTAELQRLSQAHPLHRGLVPAGRGPAHRGLPLHGLARQRCLPGDLQGGSDAVPELRADRLHG